VAGRAGEAGGVGGHVRRVRAKAGGCDTAPGRELQRGVRGNREVLAVKLSAKKAAHWAAFFLLNYKRTRGENLDAQILDPGQLRQDRARWRYGKNRCRYPDMRRNSLSAVVSDQISTPLNSRLACFAVNRGPTATIQLLWRYRPASRATDARKLHGSVGRRNLERLRIRIDPFERSDFSLAVRDPRLTLRR
jgi:hypothetical protein